MRPMTVRAAGQPSRRHARLLLASIGIYWATWPVVVLGSRLGLVAALVFPVCMASGLTAVLAYYGFWRRVYRPPGARLFFTRPFEYLGSDIRAYVAFVRPSCWRRLIHTADWPPILVAVPLLGLLALDLVTFSWQL